MFIFRVGGVLSSCGYSQRITARVDFERGRLRPSYSLDLAGGADLWTRGDRAVRLQGGILNLTNRLNVINFAGLFSGTALAPPRSYSLRLETAF